MWTDAVYRHDCHGSSRATPSQRDGTRSLHASDAAAAVTLALAEAHRVESMAAPLHTKF